MGQTVGRIEKEYILTNLVEQNLEINIHTAREDIKGVLVDADGTTLTIECSEEEAGKAIEKEHVRVYFGYYGHTMTFETKVHKSSNKLILEYPEGLVKNLERKFERIPSPEGLKLSFLFEDVEVELSFPKTDDYREVDEPLVSDYFDEAPLEKLLEQFREKAKGFAEKNKIKMFRGRGPESFEEQCIVATGKNLYLPSTAEGIPYESETDGRSMVTLEMFPEAGEGTFCGKNRKEAHRYIREKAEKGIAAEIHSPVIYHNYVVGYVCLVNESPAGPAFTPKTLDFVIEFAYILAYALKQSGYFTQEKQTKKEFYPEIINISASGVLFAYPSDGLTETIGLYTDLKLFFSVDKRKIRVGSRVMRKYEAGGHTFFGVQFLEIEPEDFRFLFDYVYGRPYNDSDDRYWEGGAEPPKLKL
jgi:hypothetical protein